MRRERVRALLEQVAGREVAVDAALDALDFEPVESLPFASIDHHRALRQGFPEVIFGEGKTREQIVAIAERIAERGDGVLVTRADDGARDALGARFPEMELNAVARTAFLPPLTPVPTGRGTILVVTAGTPRNASVSRHSAATGRSLVPAVTTLTNPATGGRGSRAASHAVRASSCTRSDGKLARSAARTSGVVRVSRTPCGAAASRSAIATHCAGDFPSA